MEVYSLRPRMIHAYHHAPAGTEHQAKHWVDPAFRLGHDVSYMRMPVHVSSRGDDVEKCLKDGTYWTLNALLTPDLCVLRFLLTFHTTLNQHVVQACQRPMRTMRDA